MLFHPMVALIRTYYWLPAVTLSVIIFIASSFPLNLPSAVQVPFYDKWAHLVAYFVLGGAYIFCATQAGHKLSGKRLILGSLAAILYGASDEWHQSFVPGRQSDLADLGADALGVGIAFLGSVVYRHFFYQTQN